MLNTNKWNTHYPALRKYVERTGSCQVPRNHVEVTEHGEVRLGAWVSYVRHRQRKGYLSAQQVDELAILPGWRWDKLRAGRTSHPERDRQIVQRYTNDRVSLQTLANEYGLTRQRVHQIVKSAQSHD
jgi:hypothetical protein